MLSSLMNLGVKYGITIFNTCTDWFWHSVIVRSQNFTFPMMLLSHASIKALIALFLLYCSESCEIGLGDDLKLWLGAISHTCARSLMHAHAHAHAHTYCLGGSKGILVEFYRFLLLCIYIFSFYSTKARVKGQYERSLHEHAM